MLTPLHLDRQLEEAGTRGVLRNLGRWIQMPCPFVIYRDPPAGRRSVERQLMDRRVFPSDAWAGADSALAKTVCQIIQQELGWPNSSFIPEDPVSLLLAGYDLDDLYAVYEIADECGAKIADKEEYRQRISGWTVGQLLSDIKTRQIRN